MLSTLKISNSHLGLSEARRKVAKTISDNFIRLTSPPSLCSHLTSNLYSLSHVGRHHPFYSP